MSGSALSLFALRVESGGWTAALDPSVVKRIDPVDGHNLEHGWELALILGNRGSQGRAAPRRALVVEAASEERTVLVDHTEVTGSMPEGSVFAVPRFLRQAGAPVWWLGIAWEGTRPIFFLDLVGAVLARARGGERG